MHHPPRVVLMPLITAFFLALPPTVHPQNATTANATAHATATSALEIVPPAETDPWRFKASMPGWIIGIQGTVGVGSVSSHADVGFKDVVDNVDMIFSFRGEIDKGPFGVTTDLVYLGVSDGASSGGPVSGLDFELEQAILDVGFHWRIVEKPEGWIDALAGFRYINLQQSLGVEIDEAKTGAAVGSLVSKVQTGLQNGLSDGQLRSLVASEVGTHLAPLAENPKLPIAPFHQNEFRGRLARIQHIVDSHRDALRAAILANDQPAINAIKAEIQQEASGELDDLDTEASRTDDWFDPYIGLRGRWNITPRLYLAARSDVGGFGVGSDLTWSAEGAFGFQFSQRMFVEAGYRALAIDYNQNGLINDTITRGAQITVGMEF